MITLERSITASQYCFFALLAAGLLYWSVVLGAFVTTPPNSFELLGSITELEQASEQLLTVSAPMPRLLAVGDEAQWLTSRFIQVQALLQAGASLLALLALATCIGLWSRWHKRLARFVGVKILATAIVGSMVAYLPMSVFSLTVVVANMLLLLGLFWVVAWAKRRYIKPVVKAKSLLAYASQTGSAKQLAQSLFTSLSHTAQAALEVRCVSTLTPGCIAGYDNLLFVVSTYGEGEAPDSAQGFVKQLSRLDHLAHAPNVSVLALGDKGYEKFCAFGHRLATLFSQRGATSLHPIAEVDRMNMTTVNQWWSSVVGALGIADHSAVSRVETAYLTLTVAQNTCLNPKQSHRAAHHIRLLGQQLDYQPGDLLAIRPRTGEGFGEERQYSIASNEKGAVDLLVRRVVKDDQSLGLASGYLTSLAPDQTIQARLCPHPGFRLPTTDIPLILVGAGTGLAPYIGFLAQRQALGFKAPIWLFFAEQHQAHDQYFAQTLADFQQARVLTKLVTVWSRDDGVYIDSALQTHRESIKALRQRSAHIYVCGSKLGFGQTALAGLATALGEPCLSTPSTAIPSEPGHKNAWLHTDLY